MISLALRSADIARSRGSKRVTAAHLKAVVQRDDQFDFLRDTVAKVPDAPTAAAGKSGAAAGAGRGAGEVKSEESDEDVDEGTAAAVVKRKRARAGGGRGRAKREDG